MLTYAWLAAILLVQPWLDWPQLFTDTSHRLTLVCCMVGLGLHRMVSSIPIVRFPVSWGAWVVVFLVVVIVHAWHVVATGDYFRFFQETALFSDGIITLLSLTWGLWALLQVPASMFRRLRWLGMAFLYANFIFAVAQMLRHEPVTGVLGMERLLGAYAVAWLPICWVWHPATALLPASLLLLSHKPLPLVVAAISLWPVVRGWRKASIVGVGVAAVWYATTLPALGLRVTQRSDTWWHALQASFAHTWIGWGSGPLTLNTIRSQYGYLLPSLHCDWLTLVVQSGWVVAFATLVLWVRTVSDRPTSKWARACQGSVLGIGVLSMVQATVSHARIAGVMLIVLAWFMAEQRQEPSHA